MRLVGLAVSGACLVLALMLLQSTVVTVNAGTTINVNWPLDVLSPVDGKCTLREAVIAANTDSASGALQGECPAGYGPDTIVLPTGTFTLTVGSQGEDAAAEGDLDLLEEVRIQGTGNTRTIVDANQIDRAFDVLSGVYAVLEDMTIQSGEETHGWNGGGIRNQGNLSLQDILMIANATGHNGGALCNHGDATLNAVAFGNNRAQTGAGIWNIGTLTLTQVALTFDEASTDGGGLANYGTAYLTDVTVASELAGTDGGGIYNTGALSMTRCVLNDNEAALGNGGGIWTKTAALTNVTLSNNVARVSGGGLYRLATTAPTSLTNVTFSGNGAGSGGGIYVEAGTGQVSLKNTIVAGSTGGGNCSGTVASLGHNLESGTSCGLSGSGDLSSTDPMLGPLANNGGETETHALLAGSPAINAGDNAGCPTTDQRGKTRLGTCDIGAYEFRIETMLPYVTKN